MQLLPYFIFLLSGVSALVFETLWFRQAGLAFGNSVWAGSMVLASFMAGLAIGNWFAGSMGHRVKRPFALYAAMEILIGAVGLGLVVGFPHANEWLLPLLRPALGNPWLLNASRLAIAFACLLLPTVAMGATLPLIVTGLASPQIRFGQRLGVLYAINTFGAMAGTLACEFVLIERYGVLGTGLIAAGCNLLAGLAAWVLSLHMKPLVATAMTPGPQRTMSWRTRRLLIAAFLSGGTLLALEVVWLRFLTLFYFGTSQIFATLLAIVLAGIGLGGLVASRWAKRPDAQWWIPGIAFVCGCWTLGAYFGFARDLAGRSVWYSSPLWLAIPLVFPVAMLSGMLFTLMGQALHDSNASDMRVAGSLSLFNTLGAMCGAWLGGFALLPGLGMERSFIVLAGTYFAVGCLCQEPVACRPGVRKWAIRLAGCALLIGVCCFPRGLDLALFRRVANHVTQATEKIVAIKETVTGTVIYTEASLLGQPISHRLLTDGHSMAGTNSYGWRYMKQYVYLPVALHPGLRKACLISFGCGTTARALTDTKELTQIDVVDISKDILAMNPVIYPDPKDQPLRDPRVRVIVEDGRFHLLSTSQRYDLITSEPPPPKAAGVVNLYTREYFQLIHDRLAPGGMATYWLPLHSLSQSDSRAIIRAWCAAFAESSLWVGSGDDWMLFGVRDGFQPVSEERFQQQWNAPEVSPILAACGFEAPGLLGATFIGDRTLMLDLSKNTEPLVDNFPYRLSRNARESKVESRYKELLDTVACRERFENSDHIRRLWPQQAIRAALPYFQISTQLHDIFAPPPLRTTGDEPSRLQLTHGFLKASELKMPVLWGLGSGYQAQRVIDRVRERLPNDPQVLLHLGHREVANRNFEEAGKLYSHRQALLRDKGGNDQPSLLLLAYVLCLQDQRDEAQERLNRGLNKSRIKPSLQAELNFLVREFGLSETTPKVVLK